MSSESHLVIKEYFVVFLYWALLLGQGVAEAAWLRRNGWATWTRALVFAGLSNLLGFCIGASFLFVSVVGTMMLAWDGTGRELPLKGNEIGIVFVLGVLLLPILLGLIKRALLALLKMQKGGRAWAFSLVSSLIFWLLPLGVTGFVAWILWRFV